MMKVAEVAGRLGVCNTLVYRMCENGELRHVRVAYAIRVAEADLEAFIAGGGAGERRGK